MHIVAGKYLIFILFMLIGLSAPAQNIDTVYYKRNKVYFMGEAGLGGGTHGGAIL